MKCEVYTKLTCMIFHNGMLGVKTKLKGRKSLQARWQFLNNSQVPLYPPFGWQLRVGCKEEGER